MDNQEKQSISVKVEEGRGIPSYANHIRISHTPEEFILDLYALYPPQGSLISRVVISPAHAQRLLRALEENMKKYEDKFGSVQQVPVKFDLGNVQSPEDSK